MLSYELYDSFVILLQNNDILSAFDLVAEAFEMFPKEKESVCVIVLEGLLSHENVRVRLISAMLIEYHNYLLAQFSFIF